MSGCLSEVESLAEARGFADVRCATLAELLFGCSFQLGFNFSRIELNPVGYWFGCNVVFR